MKIAYLRHITVSQWKIVQTYKLYKAYSTLELIVTPTFKDYHQLFAYQK